MLYEMVEDKYMIFVHLNLCTFVSMDFLFWNNFFFLNSVVTQKKTWSNHFLTCNRNRRRLEIHFFAYQVSVLLIRNPQSTHNINPNPSTLLTTDSTLIVKLYVGYVQSINKHRLACPEEVQDSSGLPAKWSHIFC